MRTKSVLAATAIALVASVVIPIPMAAEAAPTLFAGTGHYYECIDGAFTWEEARDAAATKTFDPGSGVLQGYLATVTSQAENDFVSLPNILCIDANQQVSDARWLGGTDAESEGTSEGFWIWATGPEAGTLFWIGGIGGSVQPPDFFANWGANEPNSSGNEDYLESRQAWNDCSNVASGCSPFGGWPYVVEYGGLEAELTKELTSGPNEDNDAVVDVVVPVGDSSPLEDPYDFTITYSNPGGPDAIVFDTVPAEWQVTAIDGQGPNDPKCFVDFGNGGGGTVDAGPANGKCKKAKSATKIEWNVEGLTDGELVVDVLNRQSPSGKPKFKPTSCGAIILNDGAIAFESDGSGNLVLDPPVTGDPVVVAGPTDPICLVAVEDPEGTLTNAEPSRSAAADHDGDGIPSFVEACVNVVQTNPCDDDTDGDTVLDGVDQCPLQGLEETGVVDPDGCPVEDN